jgi:dolichol kinase
MDREIKRQLIHASGALLSVFIIRVDWYFSAIFLGFLLIFSYAIALGYTKGIRVPVLAQLIDMSERPEVIKVKPAKGALCFFLGIFLTILIFQNREIGASAVVILAIGDSFSTLIGKKFGAHRLPYNTEKSVEGSLAFLISAYFAALLIMPPILAAASVAVGALAESIPSRVDDNITIPLSSGLVMYLAQ